MLRINSIRWTRDRVNHIAKHELNPVEVEEAAFGDPFATIKKVEVSVRNKNEYVYRLLGRTEAGKYIAFFFIPKKNGRAYHITARKMDESERRLYNSVRRQRS